MKTAQFHAAEWYGPPLWFRGENSWLQTMRSRVRFPALQDFLRIIVSGRGPLSLVRITEVLQTNKQTNKQTPWIFTRKRTTD
jgi:hypothetical protein